MHVQSYPINEIPSFSKLLIQYLAGDSSLKSFYGQEPKLASFAEQINLKKSFSQSDRQVLVEVLKDQYQAIGEVSNIATLANEKTFTVTTGHQLNLFTGPLYVIYKLVSTINLARKLQETYPEFHFVPVYWMATEDHDWDEINHFHWYGKKYQWDTDQKGAVGRFTLEGMRGFLSQLPDSVEVFEKAYTEGKTLAQAVQMYIHSLFGADGLLCLDADDARLKQVFVPVMEADLFGHKHQALVEEKNTLLETLGYKAQIHAREINLFYMTDGLRERIEKKGEAYHVVNQSHTWHEEALRDEILNHPERFSPNVVLRPLYQECILPNLAYLGGPAEVVYWLQLKGIFDAHSVPFPILLPRNFGLVITAAQQARIEKLGIVSSDLFADEFTMRQKFVAQHSPHTLDLVAERARLSPIFEDMIQKARAVDVTLEASAKAEQHRWEQGLSKLEKKIKKAEERNQSIGVQQLLGLRAALFPEGHWQERHENFLSFYLSHPSFIVDLKANFDPLLFHMYVMQLD
jgi:bacillithiol synthase